MRAERDSLVGTDAYTAALGLRSVAARPPGRGYANEASAGPGDRGQAHPAPVHC